MMSVELMVGMVAGCQGVDYAANLALTLRDITAHPG
jgi:hypothetical protein